MIRSLILLLLAPITLLAASPRDFAGGFILETQPNFALQRLELPFEVYNGSVRSDLGDMRVFNAAGMEVPMHLRRIAPGHMEVTEEILPVFRIAMAEKGGQDVDFRMQVRTSEQGAVLEARMNPAVVPAQQALLLDASAGTRSFSALRLELASQSDTWLSVLVQGSDDLASWSRVGGGVLAGMERQGARIVQDSLALTGRRFKYYIVSGQGDLSVLVRALGRVQDESPLPARRFTPLAGHPVADNVSEYVLPLSLPAELLELEEGGDAVLNVDVQVPAERNDWRVVNKGSLYRLNIDGQTLSGPGLRLPGSLGRFRLRIQGAQVPLRVGWVPHELVFMPQGPGPYTLALGNPAMEHGSELLAPILHNLETAGMGQARLGERVVLGGDGLLRPARNMTTVVLWAVLGLGVCLLGWMAWHLARSMDRKA